MDTPPVRLRLQGYRRALQAHGIPLDPALLVVERRPYAGAGARLQKLLAGKNRATALFGVSRILTRQALLELGSKNRALRVLVYDGFDEVGAPPHLKKWLVLQQPLEEIGRQAITLLYQLIAQPVRRPAQTMLRAKVVERDSVD